MNKNSLEAQECLQEALKYYILLITEFINSLDYKNLQQVKNVMYYNH